MDTKVTIRMKYEWNTIAWLKIRHLRHFIQNFLGVKNKGKDKVKDITRTKINLG